MLAEFGTLSLADVLAPAIQMADGYPIEAQTANSIENNKARLKQWKYSREVMLPHAGESREGPSAGEIFAQKDLAATLRKLVEAEAQALRQGKNRKEAIYAAYDRFYKGDIAEEIVRGTREQGGLFTREDLANWKVKLEEPTKTSYRGVDVYKLQEWTQGPALLQALNILENADLKSMGYNSARYIHTVYQAMSLAFADRDFYYGDPAFEPKEPMQGLLSKEYAKSRYAQIKWDRNDPQIRPGDPYPFRARPILCEPAREVGDGCARRCQSGQQDRVIPDPLGPMTFEEGFYAGTTSIQTADTSGWSCQSAERWVGARGDRRPHRGRSQPACAELRDTSGDGPSMSWLRKRPR
jgi:gamma-glutamyltranspeptidase/glutathione hydrolase